MANVFIENDTMVAIGDAIRGKLGVEDKFLPAVMAEKITQIPSAEPLIIEDMSYFFINGSKMGQYEEVNEKLIPYAKNLTSMFEGHTGMEKLPAPLKSGNAENLTKLFNGLIYFYNFPEIEVTEKCKSLKAIFQKCTYMVMSGGYDDISDFPLWDTSGVEDISYAFNQCEYLFRKTGEFPEFNLQNVLTMAFMCYGCKRLVTVNDINSAKCTNMTSAFQVCTGLTTVNGIDMASCTVALDMFSGDTKLETVVLRNTDKIQNAQGVFYNCKKLKALPFNELPEATNMRHFAYCNEALTEVILSAPKCADMTSAFEGCKGLTSIELDMASCTLAEKLLYLCSSVQNVILNNTGNIQNMSSMFSQCNAMEISPTLDMSSCTKASYLYNKCYAMREISNISAPVCTNADYMCLYCTGLVKVDGLSLPAATSVKEIFRYCENLEELLNLDFSKVAKIEYFCTGATKLRRLTFSPEATKVPQFYIDDASFDREGMVEMFNSLPDGGSVAIMIMGNPCVTDGTLTEDDIAIATAKGYTITT